MVLWLENNKSTLENVLFIGNKDGMQKDASGNYSAAFAALRAFISCDFFLEAVFLWINFLAAALSNLQTAAFKRSCLFSEFPAKASL
jgi:hypothetical protein